MIGTSARDGDWRLNAPTGAEGSWSLALFPGICCAVAGVQIASSFSFTSPGDVMRVRRGVVNAVIALTAHRDT